MIVPMGNRRLDEGSQSRAAAAPTKNPVRLCFHSSTNAATAASPAGTPSRRDICGPNLRPEYRMTSVPATPRAGRTRAPSRQRRRLVRSRNPRPRSDCHRTGIPAEAVRTTPRRAGRASPEPAAASPPSALQRGRGDRQSNAYSATIAGNTIALSFCQHATSVYHPERRQPHSTPARTRRLRASSNTAAARRGPRCCDQSGRPEIAATDLGGTMATPQMAAIHPAARSRAAWAGSSTWCRTTWPSAKPVLARRAGDAARRPRSAAFFDIDWHPVKDELEGRVLLPILEDQYGKVLEDGHARARARRRALRHPLPRPPAARWRRGRTRVILGPARRASCPRGSTPTTRTSSNTCSIWASAQHLPRRDSGRPEEVEQPLREKEVIKRRIAPALRREPRRPRLPRRERRARSAARPGDPRSFDALHRLLEDQVYRLAYWRVAAEEINYRRFFDVNDLAGLRTEDPRVFDAVHAADLPLGRARGA